MKSLQDMSWRRLEDIFEDQQMFAETGQKKRESMQQNLKQNLYMQVEVRRYPFAIILWLTRFSFLRLGAG